MQTCRDGKLIGRGGCAVGAEVGDFDDLVRRYRRELHVYCYRMLGSFDEAEDHVQEVLLRAWRSREGFQGKSSVRTWLYRVAANACLDTLRRDARRAVPAQPSEPSSATAGAGPSALDYEAMIEDTLDRLAAHLAAHIDLDRLLTLARK